MTFLLSLFSYVHFFSFSLHFDLTFSQLKTESLQAKREGAEAGGLRAGGSRNAVYGDRVRQKENVLIP